MLSDGMSNEVHHSSLTRLGESPKFRNLQALFAVQRHVFLCARIGYHIRLSGTIRQNSNFSFFRHVLVTLHCFIKRLYISLA